MLLSVQCVRGGSGVQVALLSTNVSKLESHERCQKQAESHMQILHPHYRGACDLKGSVKTGQDRCVCVCVCVCVKQFV